MQIFRIWCIFLLFLPGFIRAQEGYISGRVTDSITHEPLAFVNIVFNQSGQGVVTNLEGVYKISASQRIQFLKLRYVGYRTKTIIYNPSRSSLYRNIELSPEPVDIAEVVVYPGINPAHRIINKATENRSKNNPEKSGPFSYISYDKIIFGLERDTLSAADSLRNTSMLTDTLVYGMDRKGRIDVKRFLEKQYLFMMESVSSRKFISPQKNKEEIIASKVSGLSQPSFVIMARQFQSFSFYDNFITIADRQFLNPLSPGSTEKYFFLIKDTVYTEDSDTVFIISFRPLRGKNFDGMKGVLYINSNGYAVQNVLAEAYEQKEGKLNISIQQQYEFVNNQRWFPVLLSSTIRFNPSSFGYAEAPVNIIGTGKTYIVNHNFAPTFDNSEFSDVQIEVRPDAHRQSENLWKTYRTDSLSNKEKETYRVIDSLGKAEHLDRTITSFETILTGYLPGRYWNFDIRQFIDYNPYEGFRLGAGGRTSPLLSDKFAVGGYIAYGFKDKALKYSANIAWNIWPKHEVEVSLLYRDDVRESGGIKFNEVWSLNGSAFFRNYMVRIMDKVKETEFSTSMRLLKYLTAKMYINKSFITAASGFGYEVADGNPQVVLTDYSITEMGVKFKYAFKETFMKTPRGNKFSMGTRYPMVYLNVTGGSPWLNGEFRYWRTELKVTKSFITKSLGETKVAVISGFVNGTVPYAKLYSGIGSYRTFTVETELSFGTMRFNEFLSDRFTALFLKQDFGKLLFKPKGKFQPEIALVHNLGIGAMHQSEHYGNLSYKTMEKGYYEGGVLINNIFRIQLLRYGMGILYRYGPYSLSKTIDNFAFKFTLSFNF